MTVYTDEETYLAGAIKDHAQRLAMLAVAGDEIGLMNELDTMITSAIGGGRPKKRAEDPRRRVIRNFEKPSIRQRTEAVMFEYVDKDAVVAVTKILSGEGSKAANSRMQLAQNMLRAYNSGSKSYITMFKRAIQLIKKHLGLLEGIDEFEAVKALLREEENNATTAGPSKDRDTGEILYHLDMATRHLDVLVDYTLIAGHEDEITQISSAVQRLAQGLRSELEATRTPYDEV